MEAELKELRARRAEAEKEALAGQRRRAAIHQEIAQRSGRLDALDHEEAVRTVHDSWIDREGEQSLRRWVRSECARIWPHKFAAIEAEKDRARADIAALEELFGAREAEAPAIAAGKGGE